MRRDPSFEPNYFFILGNAHRLMGNYDDAIAAFKAWHDADPTFLGALMNLTATFVEAGRMEEARATVKASLKLVPRYSLKIPKRSLRYKDPAVKARIIENLRKAGVPE